MSNIFDIKPENKIFLFLYLLGLIYILVFRIIFNIVGNSESEFFPLEVSTIIIIIFTILLIGLVLTEKKKQTNKIDRLSFILLIVFISYFLLENNWVPIREGILETTICGIFVLVIILFILKKLYVINKSSFFLLLIGMVFLSIGEFFDAINDGYLKLGVIIPSTGVIEEGAEFFACLFFLHSISLFYLHSISQKQFIYIDRIKWYQLIIGTILIGFGNTYFMLNNGIPNPIHLIVMGLILYIIGLIIIIFNISKSLRNEGLPRLIVITSSSVFGCRVKNGASIGEYLSSF